MFEKFQQYRVTEKMDGYRETVIKREGKLHLRIDDSDSTRVRDEYLQDIFETMEWLQIPFDGGPKDPLDFKQNFSQSLRKMRYLEFLESQRQAFDAELNLAQKQSQLLIGYMRLYKALGGGWIDRSEQEKENQ